MSVSKRTGRPSHRPCRLALFDHRRLRSRRLSSFRARVTCVAPSAQPAEGCFVDLGRSFETGSPRLVASQDLRRVRLVDPDVETTVDHLAVGALNTSLEAHRTAHGRHPVRVGE